MAEERGVMAEYIVREVREGNDSKLQLVIHGNEVVAEGKLHPVGLTGHPNYPALFDQTLQTVKNS